MKLDPMERQAIIFELEMKTQINGDYLNNMPSEKLIELYKERCQDGESK